MNRLILAGIATLLLTAAAQAENKPAGALTGAAIKEYFADNRIYGKTPSGNSWFIDFKADGTFKGVTNRDGDVGKWWVEGDTLCRSWTDWAGRAGKQQACFHIVLDKVKKRVNYYNTDGTLYRSWIAN